MFTTCFIVSNLHKNVIVDSLKINDDSCEILASYIFNPLKIFLNPLNDQLIHFSWTSQKG